MDTNGHFPFLPLSAVVQVTLVAQVVPFGPAAPVIQVVRLLQIKKLKKTKGLTNNSAFPVVLISGTN
jgi:hypothetical protein